MKAITLAGGDEVIGMSTVRAGALLLTVSETGYGRLSPLTDYRVQSRGGKGLLNYHVDKYGDVAAIKVVDLTDDVILISSDGILIRIPADSIRICARPSKGVRVMRVTEGSRVVTPVSYTHLVPFGRPAFPAGIRHHVAAAALCRLFPAAGAVAPAAPAGTPLPRAGAPLCREPRAL